MFVVGIGVNFKTDLKDFPEDIEKIFQDNI